MKISDVLFEDYTNDLVAELDNILTDAKARGISKVKTNLVIAMLSNMGYTVDSESIMQLVGLSPFVQFANKDIISMVPSDDDTGEEPNNIDKEDSAEKVDSMAQATAKKDLF